MPHLALLYTPFPSLETARAAATALLGARAVACCNLLPAGESLYRWQGTIMQAAEVILIAKTTPEYVDAVRQLLESMHPYKCPAILSFNAEANPAFTAWASAETMPEKNTDKGD